MLYEMKGKIYLTLVVSLILMSFSGCFRQDASDENSVSAMVQATWTCEKCGQENDGDFCSECGASKPVDKTEVSWVCTECGTENTGAFCSQCGQKKLEAEQGYADDEADENVWVCPGCSAKNSGAFCSECGTKKPSEVNEAAEVTEVQETDSSDLMPTEASGDYSGYVPRTSIGDSILYMSVQIDDGVYGLPIPYRLFAESGYVLDGAAAETVLGSEQATAVTLTNDKGYTLLAAFFNPFDESLALEDSVVYGINVTTSDDASIVFSGDISIGMSQEDALKAVDEYKSAELGFDGHTTYMVGDCIKVKCSDDTGKVFEITFEYKDGSYDLIQ